MQTPCIIHQKTITAIFKFSTLLFSSSYTSLALNLVDFTSWFRFSGDLYIELLRTVNKCLQFLARTYIFFPKIHNIPRNCVQKSHCHWFCPNRSVSGDNWRVCRGSALAEGRHPRVRRQATRTYSPSFLKVQNFIKLKKKFEKLQNLTNSSREND